MPTANLHIILICAFSFMGFLRFIEVINIRRTDIVIKTPKLLFSLKRVKQTPNESDVGFISLSSVNFSARSDYQFSIQFSVRFSVRLALIKNDCTKYFFKAITTTRNKGIFCNCDKNVSYTRVRENILEGLLYMGVKHKRFGVQGKKWWELEIRVSKRWVYKWKPSKQADCYKNLGL